MNGLIIFLKESGTFGVLSGKVPLLLLVRERIEKIIYEIIISKTETCPQNPQNYSVKTLKILEIAES